MKMIVPTDITPGDPLLEYGSLSLDFTTGEYFTADPIDNPTALLSTNIPEDDYDVWAAGTYNLGDRVIYDHAIYEVLADPSTTDQPDVGAAKATPTWVRVSATNRWKMFDGIISAPSSNPGIITVEIEPGEVVNALAFFGLYGSEMVVTMTDPTDGEVYSETIPLQDNELIVDAYSYCFNEIVYISEVVLLDLPSYGTATIAVSIVAGSESAQCGEMVLGKQRAIGSAVYGTGIGIQSYSRKTVDDFGNYSITPRAFAKRADYSISIETSKIAGVQKLMAQYRDTAIVWIGNEDHSETVVFGFYRDFFITLAGPSYSDFSLEVEGLT